MVKTTLDERWERVFFWSDRDVLLYESLDLASGVCSQELYRLDFSLSRKKDVASDERKKRKRERKNGWQVVGAEDVVPDTEQTAAETTRQMGDGEARLRA